MINIAPDLTALILSDHSIKTSILSPLVVASLKISGLLIYSQLPITKKDNIQGQLTVTEINNPPFQISQHTKSLYYYVEPKKVWKDSQPIEKLDGEYGSSATKLIQLRSLSEWGGGKTLRLSQNSGKW